MDSSQEKIVKEKTVMKQVEWTPDALSDLQRLVEFLEEVKPQIALELLEATENVLTLLVQHPNMGERIEGFGSHDVRRYLLGDYEMRYDVTVRSVRILRIYHTREDRLH